MASRNLTSMWECSFFAGGRPHTETDKTDQGGQYFTRKGKEIHHQVLYRGVYNVAYQTIFVLVY